MDRFERYICKLDLLAPDIMLRFNGNRGIRTYYGVLLSLSYITTLIFASYTIYLTYFDKSTPTVVSAKSEGGKTHKIDLGKESLMPVFFMTIDGKDYIEPNDFETYFTLNFTIFRIRPQVQPNGTLRNNVTFTQMPIVPCKNLVNNETAYAPYTKFENDTLFKTYGLKFGLCIQGFTDNLTIEGGGIESTLDSLFFQVFPCSLANISKCKNPLEVARVNFIYASPVATLNVSNYHQPVTYSYNMEGYFFIHAGLSQKFQHRATATSIYDDDQSLSNLFSGQTLRTEFFIFDKVLQTTSIQSRIATQLYCTYGQVGD